MRTFNFYLANTITFIRLLAAPLILYFVFTDKAQIFGWLLALCFFSDIVDGFLARRLHASSLFGSKLDSFADSVTLASAILGAVVFKLDFLFEHAVVVLTLLSIYVLQTILAFVRYHRTSNFHTYLAKVATLFTGSFFILLFLVEKPSYLLFYLAVTVSLLDLIEEIILVFMLPRWRTNVKVFTGC